jgi:hypothetical protein
VADRRERLRWWIADRANRWLPNQCWSDIVDWAMRERGDRGWGLLASLPWRPIRQSCHDDARSAGRCYCGKVGSDGTVLRVGEFVCVTRMPGRPNDRLCSLPDGHELPHRCGGVEWGPVNR